MQQDYDLEFNEHPPSNEELTINEANVDDDLNRIVALQLAFRSRHDSEATLWE